MTRHHLALALAAALALVPAVAPARPTANERDEVAAAVRAAASLPRLHSLLVSRQ